MNLVRNVAVGASNLATRGPLAPNSPSVASVVFVDIRGLTATMSCHKPWTCLAFVTTFVSWPKRSITRSGDLSTFKLWRHGLRQKELLEKIPNSRSQILNQ